jgi:hypothetical protein
MNFTSVRRRKLWIGRLRCWRSTAELDDRTVVETMGCVFKYREDLNHLKEQVEKTTESRDHCGFP